ncbi:MAG: IS110 family transposase, partial [Sulfitobacter sp.]|nr:IS110 family transposase [Sulfitobacter sp.]
MKLYGGIDLHSNNSVVALTDEQDKVEYLKRLPNDLSIILSALQPHQESIEGLVVESTYNWYWLVDGLMDAGYRLHLANTAAIVQYAGLKYADDDSDARWLAKLLRLGLLPEGYIYPKKERPVRDLLRKRSQLVHQRTSNLQSVQNLMARNRGRSLSANSIKRLTYEEVDRLLPDADLALAVKGSVAVMRTLDGVIVLLEKAVKGRIRLRPQFKPLLTVSGIGEILGLTIMLETGEIGRFDKVGNYASYCRCVGSEHLSNGKHKGRGNTKNGNKYLAWAYIEAANFAVRYNPQIKRYY